MPTPFDTHAAAALGINAQPIAQGRLKKGLPYKSLFRGGRSLIGIGGPRLAALAAAASGTIVFQVAEAGLLGKLIIDTDATAAELGVTSIKHNNDELLSSGTGEMPASAYSSGSFYNATVARWVDVSDQLSVTVINNAVGVVDVQAGFTVG